MSKSTYKSILFAGLGAVDPDLISLRTMKAIANADALVFHETIHPEILSIAEKACMIDLDGIFDEEVDPAKSIGQYLIELMGNYKNVVRIYSEDPTSNQQAMREAMILESYGRSVEMLPFISKATAISASIGLSLNNQEFSESTWMVDASSIEDELSSDLLLAVQSSATILIRNGMDKLDSILKLLSIAGKCEIPIAIVNNNEQSHLDAVVGTAASLFNQGGHLMFDQEALIVIGNAIKNSNIYRKNLLQKLKQELL